MQKTQTVLYSCRPRGSEMQTFKGWQVKGLMNFAQERGISSLERRCHNSYRFQGLPHLLHPSPPFFPSSFFFLLFLLVVWSLLYVILLVHSLSDSQFGWHSVSNIIPRPAITICRIQNSSSSSYSHLHHFLLSTFYFTILSFDTTRIL